MGKIASLINVLPRRDFHDLSQSIYGTLTWGLLYPVYSRFFNAGDIVKIKPNFVLRTAPTVAPLFSPVEVRLHRFWCPLRLYHNHMRENSRKFDYQNTSRHVLVENIPGGVSGQTEYPTPKGNLVDWLNLLPNFVISQESDTSSFRYKVAAEPFIAYWDIVRNFYGFSKSNIFSYMSAYNDGELADMGQRFETLDTLDDWVESIYNSKKPISISSTTTITGYEPKTVWGLIPPFEFSADRNLELLAVCPSNPDGLSRIVPSLTTDVISVTSPLTIPSLAVAAKAQSVKDVLSAAGTRFTDYLFAFFKTSIPHSDIPSLLYSGKFWLNSSPVFQNSGGTSQGIGGGSLGSFVGSNIGSAGLSSRRYKFDEPGYLMDLLSIRPVYAWAGCVPYYNIDTSGFYWFNPRLNQLGYRSIHQYEYGFAGYLTSYPDGNVPSNAKTPFWNEFRSSYDTVHGRMRWDARSNQVQNAESSFVLQRSYTPYSYGLGLASYARLQFCDMQNINNYFVNTSYSVDNTYMSAYYDVTVSSYVSKRFATDLTA